MRPDLPSAAERLERDAVRAFLDDASTQSVLTTRRESVVDPDQGATAEDERNQSLLDQLAALHTLPRARRFWSPIVMKLSIIAFVAVVAAFALLSVASARVSLCSSLFLPFLFPLTPLPTFTEINIH